MNQWKWMPPPHQIIIIRNVRLPPQHNRLIPVSNKIICIFKTFHVHQQHSFWYVNVVSFVVWIFIKLVVSSSSSQPQSRSHIQATTANLKYIEDYAFPYCDVSDKYEKVAKIGQGTFGEVFKAREKTPGRKFVAMKKVLMENEKEGVSWLFVICIVTQKIFYFFSFVEERKKWWRIHSLIALKNS